VKTFKGRFNYWRAKKRVGFYLGGNFFRGFGWLIGNLLAEGIKWKPPFPLRQELKLKKGGPLQGLNRD